jgi:cell wall-associated NlpC family hydrolase
MRTLLTMLLLALLAACASAPPARPPAGNLSGMTAQGPGLEVVMYALGLLDVDYRFGGKNPEAGLDCSGMVSFIYRNALGLELRGSAADIARRGRAIPREALRAGDLVFFNTRGKPFSHVGIYLGDGRFIHAPSSNGRIRIDRLDQRYFAERFEAARSYFDG